MKTQTHNNANKSPRGFEDISIAIATERVPQEANLQRLSSKSTLENDREVDSAHFLPEASTGGCPDYVSVTAEHGLVGSETGRRYSGTTFMGDVTENHVNEEQRLKDAIKSASGFKNNTYHFSDLLEEGGYADDRTCGRNSHRKRHRDSFSASLQEASKTASTSPGSSHVVRANGEGVAAAEILSGSGKDRKYSSLTVTIPPRKSYAESPAICYDSANLGNDTKGEQPRQRPSKLTDLGQSPRLFSLSGKDFQQVRNGNNLFL